MYNPPLFKEDRVPVLHELIRARPFATLVTLGPGGLGADHIPLELDPEPAPLGTLRGHVARANPLWRDHRRDVEVLAVFHGPEGYVSPAWYPSKQETGKVVPTWNYAVVHAYGPLRAIEDREWLRALVTRLTDRHEAGRADPWRVTDAPDDFVQAMLNGIVGLEIPITRLEGKWKMSQNRNAADRAAVVQALRSEGDPARLAVADIVARRAAEAGTGGPGATNRS
jgi:transcriptional regulator